MRVVDRLRRASSLLRGRGTSLAVLTDLLAEFYHDRPALEVGAPGVREPNSLWTFDDLERRVAHLAAAHLAQGHANARVALTIANRPDTVLHVLALARIGATPVVINPRLRTSEFAAVLAATHPDVVVADPIENHDAIPPNVAWCWARSPSLEGESLERWMARHPLDRVESANARWAGATVLFCTSGTTGQPKAASLTGEGLLGQIGRLIAAPVGATHGFRAGRDVVLSALPLAHVMGFSAMLASWCAGVKVVHRERFDPHDILDCIEQRRPNVFVGVPTMYADLEAAGAATRDLSSIQLWFSAADVLPPETARRFQRYGAIARMGNRRFGTAALIDVYGMVELSGAAAVRVYPPSTTRREVPAVSFALPGFELRTVDDRGRAKRWGTKGRLQVRGPGLFRGYEGANNQAGTDDGWFDTKDHATVWPGGLVTLAGRDRDRLKVGGFSVFPAEVENALRTHPAVSDVALVGVGDPRLGERPVALVVPRGGFDIREFLEWASTHVAGYRRPRDVVVVTSIPRGPNGKVDRGVATELARSKFV